MNSSSADTPSIAGSRATDQRLHVAYVLSYRAPKYIRTLSILQALNTDASIKVSFAINSSTGISRYWETWRALRRLRNMERPDVYVLGFRGHEIFWFVRWLTRGTPLVFDALMSPYASFSEEGKAGKLGKLLSRMVYVIERGMLIRSSLVLTDTHRHIDYYHRTFGLSVRKQCAVPVGAVENIGAQEGTKKKSEFSVLFYGSFLPLHGIDTIVSAAGLLKDLPIRFDFIGGNARQKRQFLSQCARNGVGNFTYRRWVDFDQLMRIELPACDLNLGGPFGGTAQARRVVTTKTSQSLAIGKATVIGKIDEECGFVNRQNCLLVDQRSSEALAECIRWAFNNQAQLESIGAMGKETYEKYLSISVIASNLIPRLRDIIRSKNHRAQN